MPRHCKLRSMLVYACIPVAIGLLAVGDAVQISAAVPDIRRCVRFSMYCRTVRTVPCTLSLLVQLHLSAVACPGVLIRSRLAVCLLSISCYYSVLLYSPYIHIISYIYHYATFFYKKGFLSHISTIGVEKTPENGHFSGVLGG